MFSARAAASLAVDLVRSTGWSPRWDLPSNVTLEQLRCETAQPVDDLELLTSTGGRVSIQAKRRVVVSKTPSSALASACAQFVRQYLVPGDRAFDPKRDRLVLACSEKSSAPIRHDLPNVLARVRDFAPKSVEEVELFSQAERRVWDALLTCLRDAWLCVAPSVEPQLVELTRCLWLEVLEIDRGGRDEQVALDRLRGVLRRPSQAPLAWSLLIDSCLSAAARHGGLGRARASELLANAGVSQHQGSQPDPTGNDPPPQQLLAPPKRLFGRRTKLERIASVLLGEDGPREAVCISGSPGAGKTALALTAAEQIAHAFPDGACYVSLLGDASRPLEADQAARILLDSLGAERPPPDYRGGLADRVRGELGRRRAVVLLDDVHDENQIRGFLGVRRTSALIIVSRRPMTMLEGALQIEVPRLRSRDALAMVRAHLDNRRQEEDQTLLREAVDYCAGLPLALRILAGRLCTQPREPLNDILRRLADERTRLAEFRAGDTSVEAVLALAVEPLDESAQHLLHRIARSRLPTVSATTMDDLIGEDSTAARTQLIDARLIEWARSLGPGRWRLHDLVRVFADRRSHDGPSSAEDERSAARATKCLIRRACWAAETLEPGMPPWLPDKIALETPGVAAHVLLLDEEQNLRRILRRLHEEQSDASCALLATALCGFLHLYGRWETWAEILRLGQSSAARAADELAVGRLALSAAVFSTNRGATDAVKAQLAQAQTAFLRAGRQDWEIFVDLQSGWAALNRGEIEEALDIFRRKRRVAARHGWERAAADAARGTGSSLRRLERNPGALRVFAMASKMYTVLGDEHWAAYTELSAGKADISAGRPSAARHRFEVAFKEFERRADRHGAAAALLNLGHSLRTEGSLAPAEEVLRASVRRLRRIGDRHWLGEARLELSGVLARDNNRGEAIRLLREAQRDFKATDSRSWQVRTALELRALLTNTAERDRLLTSALALADRPLEPWARQALDASQEA
jgi:tetratricopeptide (TPR) repeat protein